MLNSILYHVSSSWVILSKERIKYEMDESNHPDWLNYCPWYNTAICSKLCGSLFEDFITHARTNKYNLICFIVIPDKQ